MRLAIVFAFVSVSGKCQCARLADGQGSRHISHRIVTLIFITLRRDRIISDIFTFSAAQRIADCIAIQRSTYCCLQLRISGSIGLAYAVRCDCDCLRHYFQGSVFGIYSELVGNISLSILNNNGIGVQNIICISSRILFFWILCSKAAYGISNIINRKRICLYAGNSVFSSVIGKCFGICR